MVGVRQLPARLPARPLHGPAHRPPAPLPPPAAGDEGWWDKHRIWVGETNPPTVDLSYSQLLASSTFCFSLMGDGFSSRFDDAVVHGWVGRGRGG